METQATCVRDLVDERATFTDGVIRAAKAMARSKPWRGTLDERKAKFTEAGNALATALDIKPPRLRFGVLDGGDSINSSMNRTRIMLTGRLSVVTLFYLLGTRAQMNARDAMKFAVNLFRVAFPRSFARCDLSGPFVRNNQRQSGN